MEASTPKTWGFRRSTLARREFMEEVGNLDLETLAPRRSSQQPRARGRGRARGKRAAEGPKRGRGCRKAGPSNPSPEPGPEVFCSQAQKTKSDLEASDSDELTLRELQERVRKQRHLLGNSRSSGSVELNDEDESARTWRKVDAAEEDSETSPGEDSDPNAVYCVCRQAHNNRFMICCDRCQEWFHGDCVRISEARGLLLEKNGEDYICPACSPCPSPVGPATAPSSSSESMFSSSAGEERPSEDEAIKGKIRKASSHSTKRKIKFFQPVEVGSEEAGLEKEEAGLLEGVAVEEKAAAPKCMGPGCSSDALPESIYCGHQCIIRHAAATMRSLTQPGAPPETKPKAAANKPVLKIQNLEKLFKKKPAEPQNSIRKEQEDLKAKEAPDHRASSASLTPSVFYRTMAVKDEADKSPLSPQSQNTNHPASEASAHKTSPSQSHISVNHNSMGLSAEEDLLQGPARAGTLVVAPSEALEASAEALPHPKAERSAPPGGLGSKESDLPAQHDGPASSSGPPEGAVAEKPTWRRTSVRPGTSLGPPEVPEAEIPVRSCGATSSPVPEKSIRAPASSDQPEEPLEPTAAVALSVGTGMIQPSGPSFQSKGRLVEQTIRPSAPSASSKESKTEIPTALASSARSEKPMAALASSQSVNLIPQKPITTSDSSAGLMVQKTPICSGVSASPEMLTKSSIPSEGPSTSSAQSEAPTVVTVAPSPPTFKNPLPSRAKKTMPGSPRLAGPKLLLTNAPQEHKNGSTVPKNPGQPPESSKTPQVSPPAPEVRVLPVSPAPVPPSRPLQAHPNMQIRQNVRRSLTETLLRRVADSDDLDAPESQLEKLAVNIEREMFNMFYTTDNKYKTKYRTLLFNLKDPKNKGLLFQLVRGHVTPFTLARLTQQELLSVQACAADPVLLKEDSGLDLQDPPTTSENKVIKADSIAASPSEEKVLLSVVRPAQPKKVSSGVSGIISSMLKDTTAEHKEHLFDLKCRICTGQGGEDAKAKRVKREEQKEEVKEEVKGRPLAVVPPSLMTESPASPASPTSEECTTEGARLHFTPPVIPATSIVTITRRDPRTAAYRSTEATPPPPVPTSTLHPKTRENQEETLRVPEPRPLPPPPPVLKSILLKPSASSASTARLVSPHVPSDHETSQLLSKQETVWKGFLNMQTVAKFVTKGYSISGSSETLKKDMPDTIHIGGRISPQTVWEYVERVKTSLTKEMSLIRFCPGTDEEEIAYVSLFSYFNSRRRFGVVSNVCNNIKDLYLIPLGANQSIPSILLPLDGPGLEQNHPNLLIGLAICQKLKRPGLPSQEIDDKRPKIHTPQEPQESSPPVTSAVPGDDVPYDPAMPVFSAPSGSLASLKAPETATSNPPSSSTTPLQSILKTLFGNGKQGSDSTKNTSESSPVVVPMVGVTVVPMVDPIVQQYKQTSKTTLIMMEDLQNDRPYDPEEEYDPALGYQNLTPLKKPEILKPDTQAAPVQVDDDRPYDPEEEYNFGDMIVAAHSSKSSETEPSAGSSAPKDDVAYDPEDESVFEEVQNYLADHSQDSTKQGGVPTQSLSEQQKMLEELNRQIEEQKRLLAEQEEALRLQRAAVGVSMAHFSVSDALMSPPPSFGRETTETASRDMSSSRDPRQYGSQGQTARQISFLSKADGETSSHKKSDKGSTNSRSEGDSKPRSHSPSRNSSRSGRSDASRRERHSSSEGRSRNDRRPYDRRTSYDSKDDGRSHRRSRRSPERSRRSRSRGSRQERSSRRHRGDTPTPRRSRERRDSPRSRSGRTRTSEKPEKGEEEKSRQRAESARLITCEKPPTHQGEAQHQASENAEQTGCRAEPDQSDRREEPPCVQSNALQIDSSSPQASDRQQSKDTGESSGQKGDAPPNETSHQTDDRSLDPLQEKESEDKSHQAEKAPQVQRDEFSDTRDYQEDLPERSVRLDLKDSPVPPLNNNKLGIPPQSQNDALGEDKPDHFSHQNLPQLGHHSLSRSDLSHPEMMPGNFNPRDQFRPRAPDLQWRAPQQSMAGPRSRPPLQPRMLRPPYPERFESRVSNYAGPRPHRPRLCINSGPSSDFGPGEDHPGVPRHGPCDDFERPGLNFDPRETRSGPEMFKGPGPQRFGPRGPSPDPVRFDEFSHHPSGPKGRFQRPGKFEDSGPHRFPQRGGVCDSAVFDGPYDPREVNAPQQLDSEPFSDFNHPRGQWLDRDSQPSNVNDLREYTRTPPLRSDNRGFEESRFINRPPRHVRRPDPRCESPSFNQSEEPRFYEMEAQMEQEPEQCSTERSGEISDGGRMEAQMQCPRFNPPPNFRAQRAPSPHFYGQRMPAPQRKDLHKPGPPNLPSLMDFSLRQRPNTPKPGECQNPIPFEGPSGKPDVRPLRLSGPLLPTPPGGPVRFHNPKIPRPSPYDRPLGPPNRGRTNDEGNPGCFDDSYIWKEETSEGFVPEEENEEYGDEGEGFSDQEDGSPGKPWQLMSKRRRRRRRRQRYRSCSDERNIGQGPDGRARGREMTRTADRTRH